MQKIDLNRKLKDLKGVELNEKLNEVVANAMIRVPEIKGLAPIKVFDMALTLQRTGILEIDDSDAKLLKEFLSNDKTLFIIAKGQILKEFKD